MTGVTLVGVLDDASTQRLRSAHLAWLTTVRADGQPQTSYVWFHHDRDDIVVLSEPGTPKVRNIADNPRVTLHLDGDSATGGDVLTMEANAEIIGGLPDGRWSAYADKYRGQIARGPWKTPDAFIALFSTAIRIVPTRVRAW